MKRNCILCREPILADSAYCEFCGAKQPESFDNAPAFGSTSVADAHDYGTGKLAESNADEPVASSSSSSPPWAGASFKVEDAAVPPAPSAPYPAEPEPRSPYAPPLPGEVRPPYVPPTYEPSPSSYAPPAYPNDPYAQSRSPNYAGSNQAQNPYGPPQQQGYQNYPPYPNQGPLNYPPKPQSQSNIGKILIGLGILLLLGAIGFALFYALRDTGGSSSNKTVSPQTIAQISTPRPTRTPALELTTPTADNSTPVPIPDLQPLTGAQGNVVYFSASDNTWVSAPASGGDATSLKLGDFTSLSYSYNPFSPDNSKLAYTATEARDMLLFIANSDGSNARELARFKNLEVYNLRWSPDGTKIAVIANKYQPDDTSEQNLYVVAVENGTISQLTKNGFLEWTSFEWSPDGQKIAFVRGENGYALHTINADGSNDKEHFETYAYGLFWTSDGKVLYEDYCDPSTFTRGVCTFDVANEKREQVIEIGDYTLVDVSPDHKWAMLNNYADGSMTLLNLTTKELEEVLPASKTENVTFLTWGIWSPDMQYVTYENYETGVTYAYKIGSKQPPIPFIKQSLVGWIP